MKILTWAWRVPVVCPLRGLLAWSNREWCKMGWTNHQLERRLTCPALTMEKVPGGPCSDCMRMPPWVGKVSTSPEPERASKCCWDSHSAWEGFRGSCGHWCPCAWEQDAMGRYRTELNELPPQWHQGNLAGPSHDRGLWKTATLPQDWGSCCLPLDQEPESHQKCQCWCGRGKKFLSLHRHLGQIWQIISFFSYVLGLLLF